MEKENVIVQSSLLQTLSWVLESSLQGKVELASRSPLDSSCYAQTVPGVSGEGTNSLSITTTLGHCLEMTTASTQQQTQIPYPGEGASQLQRR